MPIGIVLADDHPIFCQGLKALLEKEGFAVVGAGSDGFEAIQLAEQFHPDVAILDFSMPRLNGLGAAKEIRRVSPRSRIIILTLHREEQYVVEAMTVGVRGYVLKSEATTELVQAIQEVYRGNTYLSPGIAQFAVNSCLIKCAGGSPPELLSPRELQ